MKIPDPDVAPLLTGDVMSHFPPTRAGQAGPEAITPRDQQTDAILRIHAAFVAGRKAVVLEAPPGSGKSYVTQTLARATRAMNGTVSIITAQKVLQDQYLADFPPPEIELVKGRNTYLCESDQAKPNDHCDDAPCTRIGKGLIPECCAPDKMKSIVALVGADPMDTICPYWKQLIKSVNNPITLFNFHSFLAQQRLKRFGVRDLLIVDEAHNVENQLKSFVELTIPEKALAVLHISFRAGLVTAKEVVNWIRGSGMVAMIEEKLDVLGDTDLTDRIWSSMEAATNAGTVELLEDLKMRLEIFLARVQDADWVVRTEYRGRHRDRVLVLKPIYGHGFGQPMLWSKGRRILAVSATILDKDAWCGSVGFDPADVEFIQIGSDFPKENRPIYREYMGSMARAEKDATMPKLVEWVRDVLLPRHAGQRGIIHTHSFQIAKAIAEGVGSDRLLLHGEGQNKLEILEQHAARADSVIVAPAFHEGIDLKDDLARFAVIAKIPYPNLGDDVVAARKAMDDGDLWFIWQAALKLVQSYGRPVRSKEDHAETYVTDSGFEGFLQRAWRILPGWFREALTVRRA